MILIAAVDINWGIGKCNDLLYRLPEDLRFFKNITTGKKLLMGRRTLESFKNGKPLPNRLNIVLTRDTQKTNKENLIYINDINDLSSLDDVFLIGGSSVYNQYYNLCDYAYITKIYSSSIVPDKFLHNLDEDPQWIQCKTIEEGISLNGIKYKILLYKKEGMV